MDIIPKYLEILFNYLKDIGLSDTTALLLKSLIALFIIFVVALLVDLITTRIILSSIKTYVTKSKNEWNDIFMQKKVFNRLAHIAPALLVYLTIDYAFDLQVVALIIKKISLVYIIIVSLFVVNSFLDALHEIYQHFPLSRDKPIKGFVQVIKIFIYIVVIILIISALTGSSPINLLAGLGALAAVLILVFKDTLLGLVASIQITANDMVKLGDWIEMPARNADGSVLEINVNTVKVQNWDKSITTIPTYALVSESFYNWRGMEESDGRRIRRSINIDMTSVRYLDEELSSHLKKIQILKDYLENREEEIRIFNKNNKIDTTIPVNGRRMTNLGTFRKYLETYLKNNKRINSDMLLYVRHLQPTNDGIPIEITVFSKEKTIIEYEDLQSDIGDHILVIIPEFQLRVFQNPSISDLRELFGQSRE